MKQNSTAAINRLKRADMERKRLMYPNVPEHAIPASKYSDKTANGLTKCVIDWLRLNGWQAERINSTGRMIDQRQTVTNGIGQTKVIGSVKWIKGNGQKGTADISATIKGRSIKIEVKCEATGDRYQSQAQKQYQKQIEQAGGVYLIVRNFSQFMIWYDAFLTQTP